MTFYFAPIFKYILLYVLICLLLITGCWTNMVGGWLSRRRGGGGGRRTRQSRQRSSRRRLRTTTTTSSRTPQVQAALVRGASTCEAPRVSLSVPYFGTGVR
jgi:hypothetical protein